MSEEEALDQIMQAQYDSDAPKPEAFVPADWTVLKRSGQTTAAKHTSGATRKIPRAWFD